MKLEILPQVSKDLRKIGWFTDPKVKKYFNVILQNPDSGQSFDYKETKLWSYHFSMGKKNYRVLYKTLGEKIFIILTGVRKVFSSESQQFFQELDSRLEFLKKNF